MSGDRISDKYRLETPLGFGAMGMLWRAHNIALDAPVALKLIRGDARHASSSERLLREARATASLHHPAIVRVFDYGVTARRDPFIAMELLEGESLRNLLDRATALAPVHAVRLLLPILEGLDCAHARGIVHRDLKPDNIFLALDDRGRTQPKLLDFGIAKWMGEASHLTSHGALIGSPSYMSPEQAEGAESADAQVDVWGAAVVLYEMLAGHEPWDAENTPALLRAIVHDPAPSILGIRGVDACLWSILDRGLAKRCEDRWPSCRELGRALAEWLASQSVVDDVTGIALATTWLELRSTGSPTPPARRGGLGFSSSRSVNLGRLVRSRKAALACLGAVAVGGVILFAAHGSMHSTSAKAVHPAALVEPMSVAAPPSVASSAAPEPPAPNAIPSGPTDAAGSVTSSPRVRSNDAKSRAKPLTKRQLAPAATRPSVVAPARPPSARKMDFGF